MIVDAISVDDKPTTWYKDRQILLIIGIFVIVAVAVSVSSTVLLLGERNNELSLLESVPPSSSPSTSNAPTLNFASRILKALYDSTDGRNWFAGWDFSCELSYCEFFGITCDDLEQITGIDLRDNNLHGSIPSEI